MLCIRRTLADGRTFGLVSGLGAATADATYGCVAAFGLTFISGFLVGEQRWLHVVGGIFLCYLGMRTMLTAPTKGEAAAQGAGLLGAYASTLALTLTNPLTILSFTAIFAGLGLASTGGSYGMAAILVLGVFFGSALWWCILSTGVSLFRRHFDNYALRGVNALSGLIILGFGIAALVSTRW